MRERLLILTGHLRVTGSGCAALSVAVGVQGNSRTRSKDLHSRGAHPETRGMDHHLPCMSGAQEKSLFPVVIKPPGPHNFAFLPLVSVAYWTFLQVSNLQPSSNCSGSPRLQVFIAGGSCDAWSSRWMNMRAPLLLIPSFVTGAQLWAQWCVRKMSVPSPEPVSQSLPCKDAKRKVRAEWKSRGRLTSRGWLETVSRPQVQRLQWYRRPHSPFQRWENILSRKLRQKGKLVWHKYKNLFNITKCLWNPPSSKQHSEHWCACDQKEAFCRYKSQGETDTARYLHPLRVDPREPWGASLPT